MQTIFEAGAEHLPLRDIMADAPGVAPSPRSAHAARRWSTTSIRCATRRGSLPGQLLADLDTRLAAGEFDRLVICAPPRMLGALREAMPKGLPRWSGRGRKDLTKLPEIELRDMLQQLTAEPRVTRGLALRQDVANELWRWCSAGGSRARSQRGRRKPCPLSSRPSTVWESRSSCRWARRSWSTSPPFELIAFVDVPQSCAARVIVGTPWHRTPILVSGTSAVRFRPTWHPTPGMVASGEYRDRVLPPGPSNPLGLAAIRLEEGRLV